MQLYLGIGNWEAYPGKRHRGESWGQDVSEV